MSHECTVIGVTELTKHFTDATDRKEDKVAAIGSQERTQYCILVKSKICLSVTGREPWRPQSNQSKPSDLC